MARTVFINTTDLTSGYYLKSVLAVCFVILLERWHKGPGERTPGCPYYIDSVFAFADNVVKDEQCSVGTGYRVINPIVEAWNIYVAYVKAIAVFLPEAVIIKESPKLLTVVDKM